MDDIMTKLYDQFEAGLMDRYFKVMRLIIDEKQDFPMEINKSQCAKMLLGTTDTKTFDMRFNSRDDFPRCPNRKNYFPRDAVIDWYHENWMTL